MINKNQTQDALLDAGISRHTATETTNGNFDHLAEPKEVNLFNMDLQMASSIATKRRNVEHDFSTGIRDGSKPNETAYKVFEQFIATDGDSKTWSQTDIAAAIVHFTYNSNDLGTASGGVNSLSVMLHEFANSDGKLLKKEMEALFLASQYPDEFLENCGLPCLG